MLKECFHHYFLEEVTQEVYFLILLLQKYLLYHHHLNRQLLHNIEYHLMRKNFDHHHNLHLQM